MVRAITSVPMTKKELPEGGTVDAALLPPLPLPLSLPLPPWLSVPLLDPSFDGLLALSTAVLQSPVAETGVWRVALPSKSQD